jgi:hypothetical protein
MNPKHHILLCLNLSFLSMLIAFAAFGVAVVSNMAGYTDGPYFILVWCVPAAGLSYVFEVGRRWGEERQQRALSRQGLKNSARRMEVAR